MQSAASLEAAGFVLRKLPRIRYSKMRVACNNFFNSVRVFIMLMNLAKQLIYQLKKPGVSRNDWVKLKWNSTDYQHNVIG